MFYNEKDKHSRYYHDYWDVPLCLRFNKDVEEPGLEYNLRLRNRTTNIMFQYKTDLKILINWLDYNKYISNGD